MTVLTDSDILIEVTRGRDREIINQWRELSTSDDAVLCSTISVAELWHGARPKEYQLLRDLFGSLVCVTVDEIVAEKAGELLQKFHKSHGLELGDALIAASALLHGAALWTKNKKHYPMAEISFYSI